jgi:N6-adenosine-specific RNA methylase IME4
VRNHSVLFLWWTWPHLFYGGDPARHFTDHDARISPAGRLIHAWGARFVTGGAWFKRSKHGKPAFGPGYRLRSTCEPFFIAIWGNPATMGSTTRNFIESLEEENVVDGLRREHSRKPEEAFEFCDRYLPGASKCELFSRQSRPGWSTWGYEAGKFDPVVTLAGEAA